MRGLRSKAENGDFEERSLRIVSRLLDEGHTLATCGIVAAEVYSGMRPKDTRATKQLLGSLKWFGHGCRGGGSCWVNTSRL